LLDDGHINWPWQTLIGGTSPSHWSHLSNRSLERGETQEEAERFVQGIVAGDLAIVRALSGRNDLSTPEEWNRWYRDWQAELKPVTLRRWLEQMVAHPDLMAIKEFASFLHITRSVAPDLVPGFIRLARTAPPGTRWRPCLTLLLYCDRTEEAPLLFDDIEQELRDHPTKFTDRNVWPIWILQYRFGVNHFWDVAAWRRWWAEYEREADPRPASPAEDPSRTAMPPGS
jgi:hypothetical protein